ARGRRGRENGDTVHGADVESAHSGNAPDRARRRPGSDRRDDPCGAVTTALRLRGAVDREPLFLGVRIGIDSGAAVEQDGRYFGSALNIAARLAAHARSGQVLCTARVVSAIAGVPDVRCVSLGAVRFKNVAEPLALFEVVSTMNSSAAVD